MTNGRGRSLGLVLILFAGGAFARPALAGEAVERGTFAPGTGDAGGPAAEIDVKEASLADAMDLLKGKFGLRWVAKEEVLAGARPVTLQGPFTRDAALAEIARQAGVAIRTGEDGVASVTAASRAPDAAAPRAGVPAGVAERSNLIVEGRVAGMHLGNWQDLDSDLYADIEVARFQKGSGPRRNGAGIGVQGPAELVNRLRDGDQGVFYLEKPDRRGAGKTETGNWLDCTLLHFEPAGGAAGAPAGAAPAGTGVEAGKTAAVRIERPSVLEIRSAKACDARHWSMSVSREGNRLLVRVRIVRGGEFTRAGPHLAPLSASSPILEPGEYVLEVPRTTDADSGGERPQGIGHPVFFFEALPPPAGPRTGGE